MTKKKPTPTSEAARYLREILSDWFWYDLPPSPQDVAKNPRRWDGFRTLSPEAKRLLRDVQRNAKLVVRFVAQVKPTHVALSGSRQNDIIGVALENSRPMPVGLDGVQMHEVLVRIGPARDPVIENMERAADLIRSGLYRVTEGRLEAVPAERSIMVCVECGLRPMLHDGAGDTCAECREHLVSR